MGLHFINSIDKKKSSKKSPRDIRSKYEELLRICLEKLALTAQQSKQKSRKKSLPQNLLAPIKDHFQLLIMAQKVFFPSAFLLLSQLLAALTVFGQTKGIALLVGDDEMKNIPRKYLKCSWLEWCFLLWVVKGLESLGGICRKTLSIYKDILCIES